ncbi:helix-turn-helix transcriptional regulator [Phascolarctobacterium sp.]|uniref:helix-turn-helix domain-containing protein n=1 Tax=Phascolarctobacterium sp. TaxID=2049039 RepID=UPI0030773D08
MNMEFDKSIYVNNIRYLANKQNKKIGDLETIAGVSTGYISRINGKDSSAALSVESLVKIANELGVNLDLLISAELDGLSSTESYLLKFIEKLTQDTNEDVAEWVKLSKWQLLTSDKDTATAGYFPLLQVDNPIIDKIEVEDADHKYEYIRGDEIIMATSYSSDIVQSIISGDWFYFEMGYGKRVYLTEVDYEYCSNPQKKVFELYIMDYDPDNDANGDRIRNWTVEAVCRTYEAKVAIKKALEMLHTAIAVSFDRLHLKANVKTAIENYLNPPQPIAIDEEIPF